MSTSVPSPTIEQILQDSAARRQLVDIILDTADSNDEIYLDGKSYKIELKLSLLPGK